MYLSHKECKKGCVYDDDDDGDEMKVMSIQKLFGLYNFFFKIKTSISLDIF